MELNNIIFFIVLSLFIGIIPGPSTMFMLYSSLRYGVSRSYYAAAGQLLTFTVFFFIAALSIEWLTESISNSLQYLKYAGGIYVTWRSDFIDQKMIYLPTNMKLKVFLGNAFFMKV